MHRLTSIADMLVALARGDLDRKLEVGPDGDQIDAVALGVNLLAEVLRHERDERLRAQALLQDALEAYETAPALFCSTEGSEHVLTRANRTMAHALGVDPPQLVGRRVTEFARPADVLKTFLDVVEDEAASSELFTLQIGDGPEVYVRLAATRSAPERLRIVFRDVAPELEASRALQRSESRLQRAILSSQMAYWEIDLAGDRSFTSDSCRTLYGSDFSTLDAWLALGHPQDAATLRDAWKAHVQGITPRLLTERRVADGEGWRWLAESAFVFEREHDGTPRRVAGSASDITWRRSREQSAFNELSYVVSHDLTEPIRTMRTFVELVQDDEATPLSDDARNWLGYVHGAAGRMQTLIDALLQYTRVGAEVPLEPLDPAEVCAEAVQDLDTALREVDATVEIGELPRCLGHPARLRLVFANLLSNALKFRREGVRPHIRISGDVDGRAHIRITDNGIGVPERFQSRVFGLFQRLHREDEVPGTGIGLAIVKRIVEQSAGRVYLVHNPHGPGTRVVLELPAAP